MLKEEDLTKVSSSYKIFSRAACNFVFPKNIKRPFPNNRKIKSEDDIEVMGKDEKLDMMDGTYDTSDIEKELPNDKKQFAAEIEKVLTEFKNHPYKYFETDIPKFIHDDIKLKYKYEPSDFTPDETNKLTYYSPKFYKILQNITNKDNNGLHLLYSNFRTLEGIGIFKFVLDYHGYTQLKIMKINTGINIIYKLDIQHPYYYNKDFNNVNFRQTENNTDDSIETLRGRKFYVLYTGKEETEDKELYRNIFNGNLDKIPISLKDDIIKYFYTTRNIKADGSIDEKVDIPNSINSNGELIKLFIISSSGAEGIDLKNVRFVHLTEPYWHPVRIEQVIGRAKRICSHKDLPVEEQTVKVFLYILKHNQTLLKEQEDSLISLIKNDKELDNKGKEIITTTDEKLYKIMIRKKKLMYEFLTAIKESSIDCKFNYDDNEKMSFFPSC